MPCAAPARGTRAASIHNPPFNDTTDNNPCAKGIVATVNGVSMSAESLCLPHWAAKNGLAALKGVITFGA